MGGANTLSFNQPRASKPYTVTGLNVADGSSHDLGDFRWQ